MMDFEGTAPRARCRCIAWRDGQPCCRYRTGPLHGNVGGEPGPKPEHPTKESGGSYTAPDPFYAGPLGQVYTTPGSDGAE